MMYWSDIAVPKEAVRDPYEMHRVLWKLFPGMEDAKRSFLFRVLGSEGDCVRVLLQSEESPVFDGQVPIPVRSPKNVSALKIYKGQTLRFCLTANPTRRIRDAKDPERSIRVPHATEAYRMEWLRRKLQGAAEILDATAFVNPPMRFVRGGRNGKVQPVTYTGTISVKSPDELTRLLSQGIGPAKAFGCGLLLLRR